MADVFVEIRQVVLTSLLSLVVMFVFTRIGGKRQIAQMSPFGLRAVVASPVGAYHLYPCHLACTLYCLQK